MLYKHGFMLIRVVLAVNDFILWAGFSEKSLDEARERRSQCEAERSCDGEKLWPGRAFKLCYSHPGLPFVLQVLWFLLFGQFSFKSRC
jgi:hypothetical protein